MTEPKGYSRSAIAGSGAIACGLAASITAIGPVRVLARSDTSAWKAEERIEEMCERVPGGDAGRARVTREIGDLTDCDLVVEAIIEEHDAKTAQLIALAEACPDSDFATTTSSLSIASLAEGAGVTTRLFGLHVFNPVARMELVELCLPGKLRPGIDERARAFCAALGKRPVEVPDRAGFVVNRLLFPYLFDAVRTLDHAEMRPTEVDICMTLGAGHPMGPLKLLDFIGIDVAVAIGRELHEASGSDLHRPPELLERMLAAGKLGCKSGSGFYDYD